MRLETEQFSIVYHAHILKLLILIHVARSHNSKYLAFSIFYKYEFLNFLGRKFFVRKKI